MPWVLLLSGTVCFLLWNPALPLVIVGGLASSKKGKIVCVRVCVCEYVHACSCVKCMHYVNLLVGQNCNSSY